MREHNQVGVATIARHEQSPVRIKTMTEDVVDLVLLLFFDHINISDYWKRSPEKLIYMVYHDKTPRGITPK
jgi:catabolite regulation protein CreA